MFKNVPGVRHRMQENGGGLGKVISLLFKHLLFFEQKGNDKIFSAKPISGVCAIFCILAIKGNSHPLSTVIPINDCALVQRLSQSDRKAFEIIYSKYWRPLLDVGWKGLQNKQAAEDLVQGVFLSLWHKRRQLQISNLEAYLKTAVRYKVLNHIVREKRTHEFFESFYEIFQEKDTPETTFLAKNVMELIHAYAAILPAKRREVFMLYIQSRLSTKEIAETLGVSKKTVQNQLGICLQGLRTKLAPLLICLLESHF